MSDHDGTTPLDRHLAELRLDYVRRTADPRAAGAPSALALSRETTVPSALETDLPEQLQPQSALLCLPYDIRLLIWEEAIGKRYLHLAQSYSEHATSSATALAQQQHGVAGRGYIGQRCLECKESCYHCTLLAATEFVDFDVRLAARRRKNADVRGVVAVALVCRLVYNEAIPFLYKSNTFQFTSPRTLTGLHTQLRIPHWNAIRTLHLHWSFRAPLFAHYHALMQQLRNSATANPPHLPGSDFASNTLSPPDYPVLTDDDRNTVVQDSNRNQEQQPFDPTLDSMLYWQHPLLESMPSMEIDRAHWEWEHWCDACAAIAGMPSLRDLRICLRTGLVAAPGQMALFLSPLRDVSLADGVSEADVVGGGGELVEHGGSERDAVEDDGHGRWKLGLLCNDHDGWAVQQALDNSGFRCDVSRLVAQYWPAGFELEPPPFNVQYRR
ncbi:hypothetical protein MPH_06216 [Macrophomina phaseolina MS6]|uniref:DUF7730 domain-containing protein n=1 Tax=Macrophomina phaseolina (strain MS6) TaxID=1126212 RepID=K2SIJ9_MACPH|nr:hypothetical protein MPH_06216 [Macrophomina phaseolina MS6]